MISNDGIYRDQPLVIAHRGARDVAPENTLAAFQAALDARADGIELDVSRCATGEIVVLHDDTVDRTTDGSGRISELPWGVLRQFDAGSWFDKRFAQERIPLLAEVLDLVAGRAIVNIEIKGRGRRDDGVEREIAEMVRLRCIAERVIISSFNPWALRRMKKVAPGMACALLYAEPLSSQVKTSLLSRLAVTVEALHPHMALVSPAYVDLAHSRGQRVNVWTVNSETDMRRMIAAHVDGIITDYPALLRRILAD